jgi:quercetin dioxygenase-like cupin family protein
MRNFLCLAEQVDVTPVLRELALQPDLWDQNTLRTAHPETAHGAVSDIWLWFNELSDDLSVITNDIQTRPYPAWMALPSLRRLVLDLIRRVDGVQLGRVIVTKLPSGAIIDPHVDRGAPAEFYARYQIALQSRPGALFHCEDETVNFRSGEVWWVNNRVIHSVVNNSDDDRIVCIVDIRSG